MGNKLSKKEDNISPDKFYENVVNQTAANRLHRMSIESEKCSELRLMMNKRINELMKQAYENAIKAIKTSVSIGHDKAFVFSCSPNTNMIDIFDINQIKELSLNDIVSDPVPRNYKIHYATITFTHYQLTRLPTVDDVLSYLKEHLSQKFSLQKSTNVVISGRSSVAITASWK